MDRLQEFVLPGLYAVKQGPRSADKFLFGTFIQEPFERHTGLQYPLHSRISCRIL